MGLHFSAIGPECQSSCTARQGSIVLFFHPHVLLETAGRICDGGMPTLMLLDKKTD